MTIRIQDAVQAYAQAGKPGGAALAGKSGGESFASFLEQSASSAVGTLKQAESASLAAAAGQANLTEVVTAVTNAEMTMQTVSALRDRVVSAYQEILRMPI